MRPMTRTDDPSLYTSREWLEDRVTGSNADGAGEVWLDGMDTGSMLAPDWQAVIGALQPGQLDLDTIEMITPVDCARFLPADETMIADAPMAPGGRLDFWNIDEWRDCASRAYTDGGERAEGVTARLQAGTLPTASYLRENTGELRRRREFSGTNFNADGRVVNRLGDEVTPLSNMGMPEVPRANQTILNNLLGLDSSEYRWFRTAGSALSCIWAGLMPIDLVTPAESMRIHAEEKAINALMSAVQAMYAFEDQDAEPDRPYITYGPVNTDLISSSNTCGGCATSGTQTNTYRHTQIVTTCYCNAMIGGDGGAKRIDCCPDNPSAGTCPVPPGPTVYGEQRATPSPYPPGSDNPGGSWYPLPEDCSSVTNTWTTSSTTNISCTPDPNLKCGGGGGGGPVPPGSVCTSWVNDGTASGCMCESTAIGGTPAPQPSACNQNGTISCRPQDFCRGGILHSQNYRQADGSNTCVAEGPAENRGDACAQRGACADQNVCVNGNNAVQSYARNADGLCEASGSPTPTSSPCSSAACAEDVACINGFSVTQKFERQADGTCAASGAPVTGNECGSCSPTTTCSAGTRMTQKYSRDASGGCVADGAPYNDGPCTGSCSSKTTCENGTLYTQAYIHDEAGVCVPSGAPSAGGACGGCSPNTDCINGRLRTIYYTRQPDGTCAQTSTTTGGTCKPGWSGPNAPPFGETLTASPAAASPRTASRFALPFSAEGRLAETRRAVPPASASFEATLAAMAAYSLSNAGSGVASGRELTDGFRAMNDAAALGAARSALSLAGVDFDAEPEPAARPASAPGAGLVSAPSRTDVWAAARRGGDVAAGAWYGYSAGGVECASGTDCARAMAGAVDQTARAAEAVAAAADQRASGRDIMVPHFRVIAGNGWPDNFQFPLHCDASEFTSPLCLTLIAVQREYYLRMLVLWGGTTQGWQAVRNYRDNINSMIQGNMGAYRDWSGFDGVLEDVPTYAYIPWDRLPPAGDLGPEHNPLCVVADEHNPLPVHGVDDDFQAAYSSLNNLPTYDDTGTQPGNPNAPGDAEMPWPPIEARTYTRPGSGADAEPFMAGRYIGPDPSVNNAEIWEWVCPIDGGADRVLDGSFDLDLSDVDLDLCVRRPKLGARPGIAGRRVDYAANYGSVNLEDIEYAASLGIDPLLPDSREELEKILPGTMVELDRNTLQRRGRNSVVFREFECPVPVPDGNYGTVRPVVCQDGLVRAAYYLQDHMTRCSPGAAGCAKRILLEPVQSVGGAGPGGQYARTGAGEHDPTHVEKFGDTYRHICTTDGAGYVTAIGDGRVAAHESVTASNYAAHVHHWVANPEWTPGSDVPSGSWVAGAGVGNGLTHGHPPGGGFAPRAGWYEAQDGERYWFEPFVAADNLSQTAGRPLGFDRLVLETEGSYDGDGRLMTRGTDGEDCDPSRPEMWGEHCLYFQGDMRDRDEITRVRYEETRTTPYQVAERYTTFKVWRPGKRRPADNRPDHPDTKRRAEQHLVYGWPLLDMQDDQRVYDQASRLDELRHMRIQTQQRLVGVPPDQRHAEQVWVRHDGPMQFYGATRVGNGAAGTGKGGCLYEINPPGSHFTDAERPFRRVLDNRLQAWCVMNVAALESKPQNSCITLDRRTPGEIQGPQPPAACGKRITCDSSTGHNVVQEQTRDAAGNCAPFGPPTQGERCMCPPTVTSDPATCTVYTQNYDLVPASAALTPPACRRRSIRRRRATPVRAGATTARTRGANASRPSPQAIHGSSRNRSPVIGTRSAASCTRRAISAIARATAGVRATPLRYLRRSARRCAVPCRSRKFPSISAAAAGTRRSSS